MAAATSFSPDSRSSSFKDLFESSALPSEGLDKDGNSLLSDSISLTAEERIHQEKIDNSDRNSSPEIDGNLFEDMTSQETVLRDEFSNKGDDNAEGGMMDERIGTGGEEVLFKADKLEHLRLEADNFFARARLAATILDQEGIVEAAEADNVASFVQQKSIENDSSNHFYIGEINSTPGLLNPHNYLQEPSFLSEHNLDSRAQTHSQQSNSNKDVGGYQDKFLTPLNHYENHHEYLSKRSLDTGASHMTNGTNHTRSILSGGVSNLAAFPVRDASERRAALEDREKKIEACDLSVVIKNALGLYPEANKLSVNGRDRSTIPNTSSNGNSDVVVYPQNSKGKLDEAWQIAHQLSIPMSSNETVLNAWQNWYEVTLAKRNVELHYYSSSSVRARLRLIGRYGYDRFRSERLRLSLWRLQTMLARQRRVTAVVIATKRLKHTVYKVLIEWRKQCVIAYRLAMGSESLARRCCRRVFHGWLQLAHQHAIRIGLLQRWFALSRRRVLSCCVDEWRQRTLRTVYGRKVAFEIARRVRNSCERSALLHWRLSAQNQYHKRKTLTIARRLEQVVLARMTMRLWRLMTQSNFPYLDSGNKTSSVSSRRAKKLIEELHQVLETAREEARKLRQAGGQDNSQRESGNDMESEISLLQIALMEERRHSAALSEEVKTFQLEVDRIRSEAQKKASDTKIVERNDDLRMTVQVLQDRIAESEQRFHELSTAKAISDTTLIECEDELQRFKASAAAEIFSATSEAEEFEKENKMLIERLSQVDKELSDARDEVQKQSLQMNSMKTFSDSVTNGDDSIQNPVRQFNKDADDGAIKIEEYNAALDDAEQREAELITMVQKYAAAETETADVVSELERDNDNLRCERSVLESNNEVLHGQVEELRAQMKELEGEYMLLEESHSNNNAERAEKELETVREELQSLEYQMEQEKESQGYAKIVLEEAVETAEKRAVVAEETVGELRNALENAKFESDALRDTLHTKEEELEAASLRETTVMDELNATRDELEKLYEESSTLKGAILEIEMKIRNSQQVNEEEGLNGKLEFILNYCQGLSSELEALRESEAEVTKSLHTERRVSESSQDDILSLRLKQNNLQQLLDETNEKVATLEVEVEAKQTIADHFQKMQKDFIDLQRHRDNLLESVVDLKRSLAEKESKISLLTRSVSDKDQHLQELQKKREHKKSSKTLLEEKLRSSPTSEAAYSPHRRGSFRKASLERWRTGSFESTSPSGSIDSRNERNRSASASLPLTSLVLSSTSPDSQGSQDSTEIVRMTSLSSDDDNLLEQRLDVEDLIAMQNESNTTMQDIKVSAPPSREPPPPPKTSSTTASPRKVGQFSSSFLAKRVT